MDTGQIIAIIHDPLRTSGTAKGVKALTTAPSDFRVEQVWISF